MMKVYLAACLVILLLVVFLATLDVPPLPAGPTEQVPAISMPEIEQHLRRRVNCGPDIGSLFNADLCIQQGHLR
jgi:hypothetical protein